MLRQHLSAVSFRHKYLYHPVLLEERSQVVLVAFLSMLFRSLSAGKLGSPSYDIMEGRRKARPGRRARFLPRHF